MDREVGWPHRTISFTWRICATCDFTVTHAREELDRRVREHAESRAAAAVQ